PVMLTELIFPCRRHDRWVSPIGLVLACIFFAPGALMAWYGWVKVARPMFHAEAYNPPLAYLLTGVGIIALLFFVAIGPMRYLLAQPATPKKPPHPFVLGVLAFLFACVVEAIAALAFGAAPEVPPAIPLGVAFLITIAALAWLPGWAAAWNE